MNAAIFGPDLLVVLFIMVLIMGMPIWAFVDILSRRSEFFTTTGLTKMTWVGLTMGLELAAILIPLMRIVTAGFVLNYLFRVRPKLRLQSEQ